MSGELGNSRISLEQQKSSTYMVDFADMKILQPATAYFVIEFCYDRGFYRLLFAKAGFLI